MKKGKCTNYGDCDEAGKSFDIEDGQPFECPTCHNKLQEVDTNGKPVKSSNKKKKGKNGNNKLLFIIICAVVVIGIIVALIFTLGGSDEEVIEPVVIEEPTDSIAENPAVVPSRSDTLVIKVEGMDTPSDTLQVEEIEEPVAEEQDAEQAPAVQSKPLKPTSAQSSQSTAASSTKNLGYATWTGGIKNGQPHGMGTMTYSTSHTIDPRDAKGRVAQPGEYIVGEWDNGHLVQGRWFKKDGTKEAIIIGKAG